MSDKIRSLRNERRNYHAIHTWKRQRDLLLTSHPAQDYLETTDSVHMQLPKKVSEVWQELPLQSGAKTESTLISFARWHGQHSLRTSRKHIRMHSKQMWRCRRQDITEMLRKKSEEPAYSLPLLTSSTWTVRLLLLKVEWDCDHSSYIRKKYRESRGWAHMNQRLMRDSFHIFRK